jgi:DNA mismatch endonuclease (patch repair protein)
MKFAVYVHGCFWHRHPGCKKATTPKDNAVFWQTKFEQNVARDRRKEKALRDLGFLVAIVWECEVAEESRLNRILQKVLRPAGEPVAVHEKYETLTRERKKQVR